MLDVVQIKMVFVVIVGYLVIVQQLLQLGLHCTILRFGGEHIRVPAGVGRCVDAGRRALKQNGTGGYDGHQQHNDGGNPADNEKRFLMPDDKGTGFFRIFGGSLRRLCRRFRCLDGVLRPLTGFRGGVFLLDGPFLLPAGIGIALKLRVLVLCLFIQRLDVGFIRLDLGAFGGTVGLELVGAVGAAPQPVAALGGFLQLVGALQTDVILLILPQFTVDGGKHRLTGRGFYGMGELRGLFFLVLKG